MHIWKALLSALSDVKCNTCETVCHIMYVIATLCCYVCKQEGTKYKAYIYELTIPPTRYSNIVQLYTHTDINHNNKVHKTVSTQKIDAI